MPEWLPIAWNALDSRLLGILRGVVALSGAALLTWDLLARAGRLRDNHRGFRDALLGILGVLALICWWNMGRFHFSASYLQINDHYHYYLGSKYAPELGYSRLYECTAVADAQDGFLPPGRDRWIRDLITNQLTRTDTILKDTGLCTTHFTPARWQMFKHDVAWFRSHTTPEAWERTRLDHGYNATPLWGALGGLLANVSAASDAQLFAITLIDPVLLLIMWGFVWWAFGWRCTCVALLWWGTNYPARYAWTGGAFMRADWLALTTIGICLVKRGRSGAGGFALTYATLLRVFPAFVIFGLALKAGVQMWRTRSLTLAPCHRAFALGCLLAIALLVPLSVAGVGNGWGGGMQAWKKFAENSRKHYSTPATNNMGLKVLVAYDVDSRVAELSPYWVDAPWDSWMAARRRVFGERQPLFYLLVAAFVVVAARAVRDQPDWIALVLGVALLPVSVELSSYYYAILLLVGLLWVRYPWVGIALCLTSAFSNLIPAVLEMDDDIYAADSGAVVLLVAAVMAWVAREEVHNVAQQAERQA